MKEKCFTIWCINKKLKKQKYCVACLWRQRKIKPKEKYFTPNFNHKTKLETT